MIQKDIIEGNKLIAEFYGCILRNMPVHISNGKSIWMSPTSSDGKTRTFFAYENELQFHSSWEWLMPVWIKIIELEENSTIKIDEICISKRSVFLRCYIWQEDHGWVENHFYHDSINYNDGNELESKDLRQALYKTVLEFIKWYNTNRV